MNPKPGWFSVIAFILKNGCSGYRINLPCVSRCTLTFLIYSSGEGLGLELNVHTRDFKSKHNQAKFHRKPCDSRRSIT